MAKPTKDAVYPSYAKGKGWIGAITSPTDCYIVKIGGSNMNDGVRLEYYKTAKMVNCFYQDNGITRAEFIDLYNKVYAAYLQRML